MKVQTLCVSVVLLFGVGSCCPKPKCPTTPGARADIGPAPPASADPYVAALLKAPRTVEVDVMWVRRKRVEVKPKAGEKSPRRKRWKIERSGGLTRVKLIVAPNPERVAHIGASEQFPGGAGDTWKASIWIAARSASQSVGRELVDYRFMADSAGFIDGPSAGALFTAGFMAAIVGHKVRSDVTMTGTVNPDGTVGLVGGVDVKFKAALKAALKGGKKVLGYPEGNKIVKTKSGRIVNLENLASEHGAKAVPVRDIYEAFELLTGQKFPNRPQAAKADMGFDGSQSARLIAAAKSWRTKHDRFVKLAKTQGFDRRTRFLYTKRLKPAKLYHEISVKGEKGKNPGASFYSAVRSATWAYTATKFTGVADLWRQWMDIARKERMKAYAKWRALMVKRRAMLARAIKKAACKKKKWKGVDCKKLKATIKREAAAEKRKARLEKLKKAREERLKKLKKAREERLRKLRKRRGLPPKRPVARQAPKKVEAKLPPAPPKDFVKLLAAQATEMEKKTESLKRLQKRLDEIKPTTVDQALALVSGYAELVQGSAFAYIGKSRLRMIKYYQRFQKYMKRRYSRFRRQYMMYRVSSYVDDTVKFAGIAYGKAALARELSTLFKPGGKAVNLSEKRMKSIANQLFAAAKANLDYINAMLGKGFRRMFYQRYLTSNNPEYVIARLGMSRAGQVVFKFREAGDLGKAIKVGKGYAALGAAVASYMASSKLIAKLFNLRIRHKTGQEIRSVRRPITLTNALHRARIRALEAAYRAKKLAGAIPTFSRILFETADVFRKESLSGQVKALELYWRAALYSQLAEMVTAK